MDNNKFVIYHNARCSKCRAAEALLVEKGVAFEIIAYLETPPNKEILQNLLQKLGMKAEQLVRQSEAIFKAEYAGKNLSEEEWLNVLVKHPILIERPIIVRGEKAVIGRPTEHILALFA